MNDNQGSVPQSSLRDFIYLDLELVGSYLEQLVGGIPHEAQISREYQAGGEAGLNVSLFHVNVQGGGTRSYAENQTIHWDRYARLEEQLYKACKLTELKESQLTTESIEPHILFLFDGMASFEPDWSNWSSGISLAKIIIDKLHQLNSAETLGNTQPDANGMVPMLVGPSGNPLIALQKDMLSELLPNNLPEEPPQEIRGLFKPVGVTVTLRVKSSNQIISLKGNASLRHFTPHRVDRYVLRPGKEHVNVLGLVTERKSTKAQFTPLAIFVKV